MLRGKKVLITGAGGFIGSHLVEEALNAGANVSALIKYNSRNDWGCLEFLSAQTKNSIEVIVGDVRDPFLVEKAVKGCDVVFHLAALIGIPYSYVSPESYVDTNVKGTLNILEASLKAGVEKVVQTSTSETYGSALYTPIDEKHPLQGQSPYSATKIAADMLAESYGKSFSLPVTIIRPFNTYGPRQSARAVIPTVASQVLSGKREISLGSLSPVRDLTFVKDTVRGFLKIAIDAKAVSETINIGFGKGISIGELAMLISKVAGISIKIVSERARTRPKNSEVMALICNNSKAKNIIDWEPLTSLNDGLARTLDYIENNLNNYKIDMYNI